MSKTIVILSALVVVLLSYSVETAANPIVWPPRNDITPYADLSGTDQIIEVSQEFVSIYIIMNMSYEHGPTLGCQFAAPKPSCFNAQLISETHPFTLTIGNSQDGMAVAFGECLNGPVLLATLVFYAEGATECCLYWVTPDTKAPTGQIELVNCSEEKILGKGGALIINPNDTDCMELVPAESSTWGKVKALYAQ